MTTIKNLAASSAIAGVLGFAALGLGTAVASADPTSDSGSGTSSTSPSGTNKPGTDTGNLQQVPPDWLANQQLLILTDTTPTE